MNPNQFALATLLGGILGAFFTALWHLRRPWVVSPERELLLQIRDRLDNPLVVPPEMLPGLNDPFPFPGPDGAGGDPVSAITNGTSEQDLSAMMEAALRLNEPRPDPTQDKRVRYDVMLRGEYFRVAVTTWYVYQRVEGDPTRRELSPRDCRKDFPPGKDPLFFVAWGQGPSTGRDWKPVTEAVGRLLALEYARLADLSRPRIPDPLYAVILDEAEWTEAATHITPSIVRYLAKKSPEERIHTFPLVVELTDPHGNLLPEGALTTSPHDDPVGFCARMETQVLDTARENSDLMVQVSHLTSRIGELERAVLRRDARIDVFKAILEENGLTKAARDRLSAATPPFPDVNPEAFQDENKTETKTI